MSQALFSLLLLLALLSCGKKDHNTPSGKKIVSLIPEQMEEILDRQRFYCRSPSGCPQGIGRLFVINPSDFKRSAVCSGFLVNERTLVTNHHCVSSANDCANTYISVSTSRGPEKAHCLKVEFTREDSQFPNQRSTDLTVLRLDRPISGPNFQVSEQRVREGKSLIAWVVDQLTTTESFITRLDCYYAEKEASMVLRRCPAIAGNSGSPVVEEVSGEVVGVLWGSNLPPSIDATFPVELRKALPGVSVATELFPYRSRITVGDSTPL